MVRNLYHTINHLAYFVSLYLSQDFILIHIVTNSWRCRVCVCVCVCADLQHVKVDIQHMYVQSNIFYKT